MDLNSIGIQTNFTTLDWCIVVGYVLAVLALGVYIRKYISTVADFIVAGRGIKTFLGAATMTATELCLVTVMYSAQKGFAGGFAAFHIALAAAIVTFIVGITGFIVVPLRRMNVMTIPEFYEKRFGRNVRILGGTILAFSGILNMGMFIKAAAVFITCVTGLSSPLELKIIMTALLAVVVIYTALGGMVSEIVLDYVQFVVLTFGLLFATMLSIRNLGWNNIIETVSSLKGRAGFDPFDTEGFGIAYVVWMFLLGLVSCAVWQTVVIRACAAKDTSTVKHLFMWSSIGFLMRFLLPYFLGICAFVFISQHENLKSIFIPDTGRPDPQVTLMAMPLFLSQILPAGVIGIVTAGMLAAFMSTHDSYLLCWSAVLTQDVIAPCFKKPLSSKTRMLLVRIFIVCISIFVLIWGLWYPLGEDLWDYMAISGAIYFTGATALLVLGIYWKKASRTGAYLALITGFGAILGLKSVQLRVGINVASEIIGLSVITIAFLSMFLGSLVFPDKNRSVTFGSEKI